MTRKIINSYKNDPYLSHDARDHLIGFLGDECPCCGQSLKLYQDKKIEQIVDELIEKGYATKRLSPPYTWIVFFKTKEEKKEFIERVPFHLRAEEF